MNEKNLSRANAICDNLERYRKTIQKIDDVTLIETKYIEISVKLRNQNGYHNIKINLGDDYIKWSFSREKLRLKSLILELEAELKKL